MIHRFDRDLLALPTAIKLSPEELKQQVEWLHTILYHVENWNSFCTANELIDINRSKIIRTPHLIERMAREGQLKPFIFIRNKN